MTTTFGYHMPFVSTPLHIPQVPEHGVSSSLLPPGMGFHGDQEHSMACDEHTAHVPCADQEKTGRETNKGTR